MESPDMLPVEDAAARLGCDKLTVMVWLKEKDNSGRPTCPFGHAVECQKRFRYLIPKARFEKYIAGEDLSNPAA